MLGVIVATNVLVFSLFNVKFVAFNFIPVIGITVFVGFSVGTVIVHVAVFPFAVFAVIVAVPLAFAVTTPLLFTATILELLLVHVIVLLWVVLLGVIVATNVLVFPLFNVKFVVFSFIPVIGIVA